MRPASAASCKSCVTSKGKKVKPSGARPHSSPPKRKTIHTYTSDATTSDSARNVGGGGDTEAYGAPSLFEKQPLGVTRVHEKRVPKLRASATALAASSWKRKPDFDAAAAYRASGTMPRLETLQEGKGSGPGGSGQLTTYKLSHTRSGEPRHSTRGDGSGGSSYIRSGPSTMRTSGSNWGRSAPSEVGRRSRDGRHTCARGHGTEDGCGCDCNRRDESKCERERACDDKGGCGVRTCGNACREAGRCCQRPFGCRCGCRRHRTPCGGGGDDGGCGTDKGWDDGAERGCGDACRDARKCCDRPADCGCGCRRHTSTGWDDGARPGCGLHKCGDACRDARKCCDRLDDCGCGCRRHRKPCGGGCGGDCGGGGGGTGRGCGADRCGDACRDAQRCCERPLGCGCGCRRHKKRCGGGGCNDCKQCGQVKKPCRRRVPPCAGTLVPLCPGDIPEARYRVVVEPEDIRRENPLLFAAEEAGDGVAAGDVEGVQIVGEGGPVVRELAREQGLVCAPPSTAEVDLQKKRCDLTYADPLEPELVRRFLQGETVVVGERAMVNWRVDPVGLFSQNISIPRALLFEILGRDPAGGFVFRARPPDIFLNPAALRRVRLLDVQLRALDGLLPLPFAVSRHSIIYQFCFARHIKWWVRIRRTRYNTLFPGNKRRLLRFETYNEVLGLMGIMRRAFHCTFVARPIGLCFFPSEFYRNPLRCWAPIMEAVPDSVATYDYIRRIRSNPREQLAVLPPPFLGPIYAFPTLEQRRAAVDLVIERARRVATCLWNLRIQVDFEAPWSVVIDCRADVWIVGVRRLALAYRLLPLDQYLAVVDAYVDAGPSLDIADERDREFNVITNPDPYNLAAGREAGALENATFIDTDAANPGIAEFDFDDTLVRGASAPPSSGALGNGVSSGSISSGSISQGPTPNDRLQSLQNIGRASSRSRR